MAQTQKEEKINSQSAKVNADWEESFLCGVTQYRERSMTLEELLHLFFKAREAREAKERGEMQQILDGGPRGDEDCREV